MAKALVFLSVFREDSDIFRDAWPFLEPPADRPHFLDEPKEFDPQREFVVVVEGEPLIMAALDERTDCREAMSRGFLLGPRLPAGTLVPASWGVAEHRLVRKF
jgi:hypothetical protein